MAGCGIGCFRQKSCDFFKELLNVGPCFGAHFLEYNLVIFGKSSAFIFSYISLWQIYLIGQYSNNGSLATLILDVVDPFLHIIKGSAIYHIIDDDSDG